MSATSNRNEEDMAVTKDTAHSNIIDIRHRALETKLKDELLSLFQVNHGPRKLPTMLLYDVKGLQLFEEVRTRATPVIPRPCPHTWC